jgi:hypothetical protein
MVKELGILVNAFARALLLSLGIVLLIFTIATIVKFVASAIAGKIAWNAGVLAFASFTLLITVIIYEIEKWLDKKF